MAAEPMQVTLLGKQFVLMVEPFSGGYPVYSGLMVCPVCEAVWARLVWSSLLDKPYKEIRGFMCYSCAAENPHYLHPDLRPVGGSLLDNPTTGGVNYALLDAMPEVLVRREFQLHLEFYK